MKTVKKIAQAVAITVMCILGTVLVAVVSYGCKPALGPLTPEQEVILVHTCKEACSVMTQLGCEEAKPLDLVGTDGSVTQVSCEEFCQSIQLLGHQLETGCAAEIRSCGEMRTVCANP